MCEDEILMNYQIRKSNKEKTRFIKYLQNRLIKNGYSFDEIQVEEKGRGIFKSRNIIIGYPEEAKFILTAHYDTCAVSPFPNIMAPLSLSSFIFSQLLILIFMFGSMIIIDVLLMFMIEEFFIVYLIMLAMLYGLLFQMLFGFRNSHTANDNTSGVVTLVKLLEEMPVEKRNKIAVIFFDNEEKGLLGSSFYAKKHPEVARTKLLLNLDCVGDGDHIAFLAKKESMNDEVYQTFMRYLLNVPETTHKMKCRVIRPFLFPSDQMHFKKGVGVCAVKKLFLGYGVGRLHTPLDTICREDNVQLLKQIMIDFVTYDNLNV